MKFRFVKGGALSKSLLGPRGFVLGEFQKFGELALSLKLKPRGKTDFACVFGFRGVGNHFRFDFTRAANRFVLSQIRDGIQIYLQHAIMKAPISDFLEVLADDVSIRIFSGKHCFINVVHEGSIDGHWGFAGVGYQVPAPEMQVKALKRKNFEWLIFGDGYSNNRWENRDFYSWPEMAFGDKADYLNACVAAGNTRRVLEIIPRLATRLRGTNVILAVGADDVMEMEPHGEVIVRMEAIVKLLRDLDVETIHVTTLAPKPRYLESTAALNYWIRETLSTTCDSVIDFHEIIASCAEADLCNGDFPGPRVQIQMADAVLASLIDNSFASPLLAQEQKNIRQPSPIKRFALRVAARLDSYIDRFLGKF